MVTACVHVRGWTIDIVYSNPMTVYRHAESPYDVGGLDAEDEEAD